LARARKKSKDPAKEGVVSSEQEFEQPHIWSAAEAEENAFALLALFHFRRTLDQQALSYCLQHFHPLSAFFSAPESELKNLFAAHRHLRGFVDAAMLADRANHAAALRYAERQTSRLWSEFRGRLLVRGHPDFSARLTKSRLPIDWIFHHSRRGLARPSPAVAIIGSRKSHRKQLEAAAQVAEAVGALRGTVITGLATGADASAHYAARQTEAALIGVLGSGVGKIYPTEHTMWVSELLAGRGSVITEVPPDYAANADAFILRNRIVAALADIVVVVSGRYASGTSHTLRFAADQRTRIVSVDPMPESEITKLALELGGEAYTVNGFIETLIGGDD
jgi:predicted Rossmann fold nucleotide-binding protein DprA/Smf involved in DNA uptake